LLKECRVRVKLFFKKFFKLSAEFKVWVGFRKIWNKKLRIPRLTQGGNSSLVN